MKAEVARELLAPPADVWAFLAEPYHLADWWPRVRGVQPDRRGLAPGARWQVHALERMPLAGWREPRRPTPLLVGDVRPGERLSWRLLLDLPLAVDVRLAAVGADRTLVTLSVEGSRLARPRVVARRALDRLYDLCQTAASF